jgi:hypothetical protein
MFSSCGPFSILWDTWKSNIWDLFTHAGFSPYIHHDGAGFCTDAFVHTGCKIWGIHHPRVTDKDDTHARIFHIIREILFPHSIIDCAKCTDLYNFFLMKSDVL